MSLAFLSPVGDAVARSPLERLARDAGAHFEVLDGWNVPVRYKGEGRPGPESVAWADVSHLRKWEVRGALEVNAVRDAGEFVTVQEVTAGGDGGEFGTARRVGAAWWCRLTSDRALILGGPAPEGALDVTCNYAALTIVGPAARETIARFCALDLRPDKAPPHSFRPGSIARQPGMILVEAPHRFLLLFGWAIAEYVWTVVADAAQRFGGAPIGIEALNDA